MIPRRPFPDISLEPPPVTSANFDVPRMEAPPPQQSNLAGQVNQLGQLFQLGRYAPKGSLGGVGSKFGSVMGGMK